MATETVRSASLSKLIPIYYEKRLLERLTPRLMYHQFGEAKALPKREGESVYWHRWNSRGYGRVLAESGAGTTEGISASRVSASLYLVGDHAKITTYVDMVAITSVVQGAIDLFADSSALTLDYMTSRLLLWKRASASAQFQVSAAGARINTLQLVMYSSPYYAALSAASFQAPVWSIDDLTTRNHAFSASPKGTISATPWSPEVLRKIALKLKIKNAMRFDDGYYKVIMHPDVVNQLRSNSAFIDLHKYVETGAQIYAQGNMRQGSLERGLVGVMEGFKFYETTEAPLFSTSGLFGGTANGTRAKASAYGGGRFYFSFFFGKNAYGVTDFDGGVRTYIKTPGPQSTDNPLDLYSTVGYRIIYTAKVLNSSACLWVVNGRIATTGV